MRVVGIDPSLTGTGVVVLKNGALESKKVITSKPTKGTDAELQRLVTIIDQLPYEKIDLAVIEGLAYSPHITTSITQLSGLNYLIRYYYKFQHGIPFLVVPPSTLKKFVTGKGNVPKEVMMLETYKRYHCSFTDQNACDAYGLAKIGEEVLDKTDDKKLPSFQREVITLLKPCL